MKKLLSLLLICAMLGLTACSGGAEDMDSETDKTVENESEEKQESYENQINVLCYNIYYQNVADRSENIQDLILQKNPDVLMLQEVSVEWIPYLQDFVDKNGYDCYGYGRYGGEITESNLQNGEQFTPVLWKTDKYDLKDSGHFWLSSTPESYSAAWEDGIISNFPRCVNWVILQDKETGGEFMAVSIHTDPENEQVRTNSSKLTVEMVDEIRGERPAIIAGDWNMKLTDDAYLTVSENGYPDVRMIADEADFSGSFNAWGERSDDNFAFGDHIFVSDGMAAKVFEVVDDYYDGEHISDHNPLYTELFY